MLTKLRAWLRKRPIILLLIILTIIIVLAFVLNDYVQERIAPSLLSWMWHVYIMSSGFPQVMTWAFFIAAIPVIAIFSLIRGRPAYEEDLLGAEAKPVGQVQTLAHWIQQSPDGEYFRMRLVRHLSHLALDTLAYRERLPSAEVRAALKTGDLQLDPEIYEYLQQGWRKRAYETTPAQGERRRRKRQHLRPSRSGAAPWRDPQTERIIQFLETELEVTRES